MVVTVPSSGDEYFLPNLPNSPGLHDGLTANVYWTADPYLHQPEFQPAGPVFPLTGYGWALDARGVNQSVFLQRLHDDGGSVPDGEPALIEQAASPFNYWKHLIARLDSPALKPAIAAAVAADTEYPFPTGWVHSGAFLPLQLMPGFQQNLIRWYTAWGAWNLLNNTSGLFVTLDGKVELPSFTNSASKPQPVPLVVQTWDGSQRFTLLNRTAKPFPSAYDLYPGNEVYFAANAYLPGLAGVLTSYVDYTIFDGTGKLNPRQTDLWLGFAGDTVDAVMRWADDGNTEPGGQANKPFMMGADSSLRANGRADTCRLQISNSFLIVRYAAGSLAGKLYCASFYAAPA
ncbi:MAG: hypothetical protein JNM66_01545 [Bryobacterales bacterium]|nr:hypothetical protein [Bryobacterales bacterium]